MILDGARRCFARWGYEGATVPRLEREIGLSHGAIFNHFENKLDLFLELGVSLVAGFGAYHASKWAVEGLSQTLAEEVAPAGTLEPLANTTQASAAAA